MRMRTTLLVPLLFGALLGACGSDDEETATTTDDTAAASAEGGGEGGGDITIAVTTTVLGDVVSDLMGDMAEVVTIMPPGANPHDFQASAQQAATLADADAIVINGGGFEEGLASVVEGAESDGVPVLDALALLGDSAGDHAHDGDEDHAHDGEDDHAHDGEDDHAHDGEDDHAHEGEDDHAHEREDGHAHEGEDGHAHDHDDDAHFFTDPLAVATVVDALAHELPEQVPSLDADQLHEQAEALVADIEALHADIEAALATVPEDRRVLVTDHDVLQPFADRYGFEVVATVIPAGSTSDGVSGGALAELAEVMRSAGVRAVFTEATASARLAETLASEVGDVEVVALHAESLGAEGSEAATYDSMMRLNAERIAGALGG